MDRTWTAVPLVALGIALFGLRGMLALRKMRSKDLTQRVGITEANLSLLQSGTVRGIRFATPDAICAELGCGPSDILDRVAEVTASGPDPVDKPRRPPLSAPPTCN